MSESNLSAQKNGDGFVHQWSKRECLISISATKLEKKFSKKCPKVTFRFENFFLSMLMIIRGQFYIDLESLGP